MLKRRKIFVFLLIFLLACGLALAGWMVTTGGDEMPRNVLAGGGGSVECKAGYVMDGALGQNGAQSSQAPNGYQLTGGYHIPHQGEPFPALWISY